MPRENEPLGEIASSLLFENESVRIWNLVVEPGTSSQWHLHDIDYVTVTLEGIGITVEYENGIIEEVPSAPGTWRYHGEHSVHRVLNYTNTRYKNILIELKDQTLPENSSDSIKPELNGGKR